MVAILISLSLLFIGGKFDFHTKSNVGNKTIPKLQIISGLSRDENIVSLAILNKNKVIVTLDPKPDIVTFNLEQPAQFLISSVFERNGWQLNDIDFIDSLNGFAVGQSGTILKTSDGGETWNQTPRFTEFDFRQVKFFNQLIGYIAGRYGKRNKITGEDEWRTEIFKTEDGGNTWTKCYQGNGEREVFEITAVSPDIALALIDGKHLIRTNNGGKTWEDVFYDEKNATSITFTPNNIGWLIGSNGVFFKSDNLGKSWEKADKISDETYNYRWSSIGFDSKGNGVVISENGMILFTNNNGKTWENFPQKMNEPLHSLIIRDGIAIILGANNVYKFDF